MDGSLEQAKARGGGAPVIEMSDARLTYEKGGRRVDAIDGVSLSVGVGERVAIIGPSGSGKSSLMRVLGGVEELDDGALRVAGRDVARTKPGRQTARDVGMVFQDFGLVPQLTALQNVLCGRLFDYDGHRTMFDFGEEDRRRAAGLLTRLGLGDRLHQKTSKLSGGERQRVGIARLLLQSPELVLLDEPVSALDVHWAGEALDLLDAMRRGESTIVTVLHDLSAVRRWADRAVLVRDGQIVYDGDPDEACSRLEAMEATTEVNGVDNGTPEAADAPEAGVAGASIDESLAQPGIGRGAFYAGGALAFLLATLWAFAGMELSVTDIFSGLGSAGEFLGRLLPDDMTHAQTLMSDVGPTLFESLVETVQMALIGTTLAAVVSLPIAVLAARNVSPALVRAPARLLLNTLRTIPSIIWGLFFVAMVGLGPLPGILALTFYASGYLGKFYYEGIESISPEPVQALRTVGASRLQQFRHGVFPQVLPLLVGYTLYMFEYNVRAASILGVVGAGGIGFYLYTYINNFNYPKATIALLMLLAVVTIIDSSSSYLRRRIQE